MRKIMSIFIAVLAMLNITDIAQAQNSAIDDAVKRGELRVAFDSFVPWAFKSKKGEYVGFEIDVAKELANDLGLKLKLVPTPWKDIIAGLVKGDYDVIIGGMSVTAQRNLQINFTNSYNDNLGSDVVVNSNQIPKGRTRVELNNKDTIIGVRSGTTILNDAKEFFSNATVSEYDNDDDLKTDLLKGKINMWIAEAPQPGFFAEDHPNKIHKPFKKTLTQSQVGMGVKKNDPDTLNVLNNWIASKYKNRFLEKRLRYWFGTRRWENLVAE